jgi:transcription-repair coupling factor (superfamily II helicase)
MAAVVKSAVPEATIGVAHGQMSERALERAMLRFLAGEFSVLVCTTIIESGLDIPNANTIIMNRADKLGLAQLYQLRGRVGRDRYQAYAYLLVPGLDALSDVSRKRLRTIEELSGLSSGFQLASRDLEIRGAGNILGPEQSGHITALGFDMYCRLLEDAVAELKGQKPSDIFEPMLSLGFYGAIPADYVRHAAERLELYHRISLCDDEREIEEIADELLDRYGGVPDEVEQLIAVNVVRIRAQRLRIERLERAKSALDLQFHPTTTLSPERLVIFLTAHQQTASLVSDQVIRLSLETTGWRETYTAICNHLRALAEA